MAKVDKYGMKSGIIKIIPPKEWKDAQPPLDDLVKQVRVREPIKQDIMGSNGTYRQVNILHGRSYNVPQWRQLCEQSEHQPPAKRGERRANAERPKAPRPKPAAPKSTDASTAKKKGRKGKGGKSKKKQGDEEDRPMTPVSPKPEDVDAKDGAVASIEKDPGEEVAPDETPAASRRMGNVKPAKGQKTQSVSARRKFSRREGSAMIDEEAFKDFDYRIDGSEFTPERCEELERSYWKTLTYAQPLYGADMMGTLFDDRTDIWNLNKLPNILDVLGSKVPGVNTAYLYLGMWKATFAWHLEDVDLYSINYLHFGAPKQWYSISQADARRFEGAMKNIWPADAKACPQFLRHKGFLISPQHLLQNYNIKVNKVVSYPGEFVVTYPYGYHSGYNLGYNCAEAVNFALEPWLEMGKIAKKCECAQAQDSVWIDVHAIERKLRGEETEYEETEDEEDEEDEEMSGLPSPPASHGVRIKQVSRKRKREPGEAKTKVKKIKLRLKSKAEPPCCLCPNDYTGLELLPTDDGRKAHKTCALYLPETYIDTLDGNEAIFGMTQIHKDRLELKCLFCRSKRGACFQCSQKKCARAYHATCAAAAGVFVEEEEVPVFGEDGTEYKEQAFEFSCRFHRTKRDKKVDSLALDDDKKIQSAAAELKVGDMCQMQFLRGEIFAGLVVENRVDEQTLLLDIVPNGQRLEVEWKWLLLPDPSDYHLPKASSRAIPMPTSRKAKDQLNAKRADDKPRKDDLFGLGYTWAEFNYLDVSNKDQVKVDLEKPNQVWHYLGKTSTEAKAQYTEDHSKPRHNPAGTFLDTVPKPPPKIRPLTAAQLQYRQFRANQAANNLHVTVPGFAPKPYAYKPREIQVPGQSNFKSAGQFTTQQFAPQSTLPYKPTQHQAWNNYKGNFQQSSGPTQPVVQHNAHQAPAAPPHQQHQQHHQQQKPVPVQSYSSWQVHPPVSHQSSYFQMHPNRYASGVETQRVQLTANRDLSNYRATSMPNNGLTNGQSGEAKAPLGSGQPDLLRHPSTQPITPSSRLAHSPVSGASVSTASNAATPMQAWQAPSQHPASRPQSVSSNPPMARLVSSASPPVMVWKPNQPVSQAAPTPVNTQSTATPTNRPVQHNSTPATSGINLKTTKLTSQSNKQSPVPLPPNFLAAMSSSPPASSPSKPSSPLVGSTNDPRPQPQQPSPAGLKGQKQYFSPSPGPSQPSQVPPGQTTAAFVPRFPIVTPHQAAAKAAAAPRPNGAIIETAPAVPYAPAQTVPNMMPNLMQQSANLSDGGIQTFPDVPGGESMEFVERLMGNLRRVSQRG